MDKDLPGLTLNKKSRQSYERHRIPSSLSHLPKLDCPIEVREVLPYVQTSKFRNTRFKNTAYFICNGDSLAAFYSTCTLIKLIEKQ